jgi:transcriptional regulator with XRE-family HTH domain
MKQKDNFKKILGLTQDDIAPLLGISRSQWSMYEIGKRSLSPAAAVEFYKLLHYLRDNHSKELEMQDFMKEDEKRLHDQLKREIDKNEYKMNRLTKKRERAEHLYEESLAALRVVAYLESQPDNERTVNIKKVIQIKTKAAVMKQKALLRKHTHDIAVLQLKNNLIKKEIKNFKYYLPDI